MTSPPAVQTENVCKSDNLYKEGTCGESEEREMNESDVGNDKDSHVVCFYAHRAVLSARCPALAKMLRPIKSPHPLDRGDCDTNQANGRRSTVLTSLSHEARFDDVLPFSPDIFAEFLHMLYTGTIRLRPKTSQEKLQRYIDDLKSVASYLDFPLATSSVLSASMASLSPPKPAPPKPEPGVLPFTPFAGPMEQTPGMEAGDVWKSISRSRNQADTG